MIISRSRWERYFAWWFSLGASGIFVTLAVEFASDVFDWSKRTSGRPDGIVSHAYEFWVGPPIWWAHQVGLYLFFSLLPCIVIYLAVRGFVHGWKS